MVHLDYENGSSTRINETRFYRRADLHYFYQSSGGLIGVVPPILAFSLSSIYFWRKFNSHTWPLRFLGTLALSVSITGITCEYIKNSVASNDLRNQYNPDQLTSFDNVYTKSQILHATKSRLDKQMEMVRTNTK